MNDEAVLLDVCILSWVIFSSLSNNFTLRKIFLCVFNDSDLIFWLASSKGKMSYNMSKSYLLANCILFIHKPRWKISAGLGVQRQPGFILSQPVETLNLVTEKFQHITPCSWTGQTHVKFFPQLPVFILNDTNGLLLSWYEPLRFHLFLSQTNVHIQHIKILFIIHTRTSHATAVFDKW